MLEQQIAPFLGGMAVEVGQKWGVEVVQRDQTGGNVRQVLPARALVEAVSRVTPRVQEVGHADAIQQQIGGERPWQLICKRW